MGAERAALRRRLDPPEPRGHMRSTFTVTALTAQRGRGTSGWRGTLAGLLLLAACGSDTG